MNIKHYNNNSILFLLYANDVFKRISQTKGGYTNTLLMKMGSENIIANDELINN